MKGCIRYDVRPMRDHISTKQAQDWRDINQLDANVEQIFEETIESIFISTLQFVGLVNNNKAVTTPIGLAEMMSDEAPEKQSQNAHMAYCFFMFFIVDHLGDVLANRVGMHDLFSIKCQQASGLSSSYHVGGGVNAENYFSSKFKTLWRNKRKAIQRKIKPKADSFCLVTGPSDGLTRVRRNRLVFFRCRNIGIKAAKAGPLIETLDFRRNMGWMELERYFQLHWESIIGVQLGHERDVDEAGYRIPAQTTTMVNVQAGVGTPGLSYSKHNLNETLTGTPSCHNRAAFVTPREGTARPRGRYELPLTRNQPGSQFNGLTTPTDALINNMLVNSSSTLLSEKNRPGTSPMQPLLLEKRLHPSCGLQQKKVEATRTVRSTTGGHDEEETTNGTDMPGTINFSQGGNLHPDCQSLSQLANVSRAVLSNKGRIHIGVEDESSSDDDDGSIEGEDVQIATNKRKEQEPSFVGGTTTSSEGITRPSKQGKVCELVSGGGKKGEVLEPRGETITATKTTVVEAEENDTVENEKEVVPSASSIEKPELAKLVFGMKGLDSTWCKYNFRKLEGVVCDGPECGRDLGNWKDLKADMDSNYIYWTETPTAPKDGVVCAPCYGKGHAESKTRSRREPRPKKDGDSMYYR